MTNGNTAPAMLITVPLSHYCEKARWALDRGAGSARPQDRYGMVRGRARN